MFTLQLDDETAARLQALARQQNRTPTDVVRDLVEQIDIPEPTGNPNWLKRIAELAEKDRGIAWNDENDTAERSREILNNEFADYLLSRMERGDNESK
ncbi:MAG: ribbon-helix-helix protein, CopG family [Chloroflexi bacterium]|nr:ribbon-helix-helix protein, CopG family [Chloroflexota bacterium]MCC6895667.1 ribbon-helix-helix protein, CopG family [Anaerolineae bacterium]